MLKNSFAATALVAILLPGLACRETVKTADATAPLTASLAATPAALATGYELVPGRSIITWEATYFLGGGGHAGTIKLSSGNLAADGDGKWVGGYFVIDMNTIDNTDIEKEEERRSLVRHLKNEDFFHVSMHPTGNFTLTSAVPATGANQYTLTGKLTLKGLINAISFPATITPAGDSLRAQAKFAIDRTKWGVNYQSGSVVGSLKDGVISDNIPVTLDLVFKKMQ